VNRKLTLEETADPEVIREYLDYLREAFDAYRNKKAENGQPLNYIDALMIAHNFHKMIVLDLEGRIVAPPGWLFQVARDTWNVMSDEYIQQRRQEG
jgi:hypothetical protein